MASECVAIRTRAVQYLLGTEGVQLARPDGMGALKSSRGGEGVA